MLITTIFLIHEFVFFFLIHQLMLTFEMVFWTAEIHSYTQASMQLSQLTSSLSSNQRLISCLAVSTLSEPWHTFLPISMEKSPRMDPGAEANGLVSPNMARPCLTTSFPSQTF